MSEQLAGKGEGGKAERLREEIFYMGDPYLSHPLTARPSRHSPEFLESKAKASLFPSLSL